jgi:YegS/Rv2252/BmrU family lipid kinase
MSVAIIINPISGGVSPQRARRRAEHAAAVLSLSGVGGHVTLTEHPGHARELARAAVAQGTGLVVAWGGDGTVNEVASALAFGSAALGIVPAGSGNGLARALGISSRPEMALREAFSATPRRIDVGEFGERLFVSVAGVGFDAHVAACFAEAMPGRRRFSGYLRVSARALASYRPQQYRVSGHAGGALRRALLVTVANGPEFGNGARIAPDARVDDGQLDLVVVEELSRFRTLCAVPSLFTGGIANVRGVSIQRVTSATIEAEEPMRFHVDGEPATGGRRLEARVHPGALSVAVR